MRTHRLSERSARANRMTTRCNQGLASVAENVTARALGLKPQLRVIEGGQRDVRQPLDEATPDNTKNVASG